MTTMRQTRTSAARRAHLPAWFRMAKKRPQREPEKLRPFHKVPRERDIDTILMWVIEPSIPIKMCFRRTPQFVVMRHRAGIPHGPAGRQKCGPSSGEAEAEV
jgi:hypothetical protein